MITEVDDQLKKVKANLEVAESTVTSRISEAQVLEGNALQVRALYERNSHELMTLGNEIVLHQDTLDTQVCFTLHS